MSDISELASNNFWHFGDPDHFKYEGVDYILVPITGHIIACFRADDLQYINYSNLSTTVQDYLGWCAVGIDGNIYTSSNHAWGIHKYEVNWNNLINNSNDHNSMTYTTTYYFKDGSGNPMQLFHMQGGEFTPSGELLYVVCGSAGCNALGWFGPTFGPGEPMPSDGIHVFETAGTVFWNEIKRSTNSGGGTTHFNYNFNNNCTCLNTGSQTPEGLTIWDLDDGSAPNIRGQLHVLKDHYNEFFCDDAVTMQSFSHNIFIDKNDGVSPPTNPLTGSRSKPFKTVNDAYNYYPIWNGAIMVIKAGTYNDTGIYNKRIKMTSEGGTAVIGQQ